MIAHALHGVPAELYLLGAVLIGWSLWWAYKQVREWRRMKRREQRR